ncbi:hypothetical protein RIR_jg30582.t1 [Rhizophagus irregularis DAOM 181602=DAOM 197198]|nr:hypothetical protein RIR_jg30582.t1 [Rhizophagus irregularis DAOM 181602=DAOM 197198]
MTEVMLNSRDFNGTNGPIRFKESLRFDDKFSQLYQRTDHHGSHMELLSTSEKFSIPSTKDQLFKSQIIEDCSLYQNSRWLS